VLALADGASEGIYVKKWVDILLDDFCSCHPDLDDPVAYAEWLERCRSLWFEQIDYANLTWPKRPKVDRIGGAATFIGFRLEPADDDGLLRWKAWAVGDACLFQIRRNRLFLSFPIFWSDEFGVGPALLGTRPEEVAPVLASVRGTCRPGEQFVFATDAVAAWLLRSVERDTEPDWSGFHNMDDWLWRLEIERLRAERQIANDDCTLLSVRITEAAIQPETAGSGLDAPD
jgi:hypothetical protein